MAVKKDFTGMKASAVFDAIAEATAEQETAEAAEMPEAPQTQGAPIAQEIIQDSDEPNKRKERKTYNEQEAAYYTGDMKSKGRKGLHLPRINLAFAPDVYDYIRTMARVSGMSFTEFVNMILRQHMKEHEDKYKQAIEFRNSL